MPIMALPFSHMTAMADRVLYSGVACITDLIVKEGLINLDFADVRTREYPHSFPHNLIDEDALDSPAFLRRRAN
jgi:hypothetical protein